MSPNRQKKLSKIFRLLIIALAFISASTYNLISDANLAVKAFIGLLIFLGMSYFAYKNLLRAKKKKEPLAKHYVVLAAFAFAILLDVAAFIFGLIADFPR